VYELCLCLCVNHVCAFVCAKMNFVSLSVWVCLNCVCMHESCV
jgi:hypothetical protein